MEIIMSRIKLIDGTILESRNTHDMVCHEIDGKRICLDGGIECTRIIGDFSLLDDEDVNLTTCTPIEEIREIYTWGTYGKNGDENYRKVLLKDMSNDHIESIIRTQHHIPDFIIGCVFKAELVYRDLNDLFINDLN